MKLLRFLAAYNNKPVDFDKAYGPQCVDLLRFYIQDVLHLPQPWGVPYGAKYLWKRWKVDPAMVHYKRIAYTPGSYPKLGDIAIFGDEYGPWGHVIIVLGADADSMVGITQNDTDRFVGVQEYTYEYVLGWLSPINEEEINHV